MTTRRRRSKPSVLDELDTRPLTRDEIVAMGYDPQEDGWHPFRSNPAPDRTADTPVQDHLPTPGVTPLAGAPQTARVGRKGRTPRSPRSR